MPISINARAATYYQQPHSPEKEEEYSKKASTKNLIQYQERKEYNGELSDRAKSKIKNYASNMLLMNAANINRKNPISSFITLTLPSEQIHSDNEIKRDILQPFIAECKRVFNLTNYIWVAELQKNGNIHFHIITPTYINKFLLQKTWNKHTENLGYVSRSKSKNPPSTHIRAIKQTSTAIAYITKYLSKGNKDRRKITGRLWGCDTQTEKLKNIIIQDEQIYEIDDLITRAAVMEIKQEYFTTYILNINRCKKLKIWLISKLVELLMNSC